MKIRKQTRKQVPMLLAAALATMVVAGCQTTDPYTGQQQMNRTSRNALIGAGIGVAAGLLTGDSAVERRQHALIGAGVGGLAGGAVGVYQDRQQAALRDRLQGTGVDVSRTGDNITLNMPGNITFAFNSSNLAPEFYPVLNNVAGVMKEYDQTVVEVAGHTDSVGSDEVNQRISEQRANAVTQYLVAQGLNPQRFITIGAGEHHPIASNDTESGRAANRRVEITLVPVRS